MLILCGLSTVPVFAQSQSRPSRGPASSVGELGTKLKSGDTIYVLDTNARETPGIFAEASESSIRLLVEGQIHEIPAGDVRRVARRGDPLWNGALIGAAAVGTLVVSAQRDSYCAQMDRLYGKGTCSRSGDPTAGVIVGAAIGGAIGAGIDALIHGRTVVYRVTPQRIVRLVPALSDHQVGARLSVGFWRPPNFKLADIA
jgi:hypothetical protein